MNKIVEEQLLKVQVADIPEFNEATTHLIIPKKDGVYKSDFVVGGTYIIRLEDYLVHPFEGFTLHDNWNNGVSPETDILQATVTQTMGKMVCVDSMSYDIIERMTSPPNWKGWLPKKGIKILDIL